MSYEKKQEFDFDATANFLKNAVKRVRTNEDPDVLNDFKKVFKKNVPLTLRSYVVAYLLKKNAPILKNQNSTKRDSKIDSHFERNKERGFGDHGEKKEKNEYERKKSRSEKMQGEKHSRVQLDPALSTTIFIGAGRNRKVFPRDLISLIENVAEIDRKRIGEIRVLSNYSFVQLLAEDAQRAIEKLNASDFRGRKIAVSFSRQKVDEQDENPSDEENAEKSFVQNENLEQNHEFLQSVNSDSEKSEKIGNPDPTAEEIFAARAPRSSSSDVAEAAAQE